jgi:hypothetical protein
VGRRRSCFSCGEVQTGGGAFCSACGKPIDAPDLELIAGDTTSNAASDVVLSSGSPRGRSMLAIGVVLAALIGVAAFSGAGKTSTTVPTTTTTTAAPTTSIAATTTATTTTINTPITQQRSADPRPVIPTLPSSLTIVPGSDAPTVAPTGGQLGAPPLPGEKTGAKLLLLGLYAAGDAKDTIIDLDSGALTRLDSATLVDSSSPLLTTATGLVLNGSGGFNVQFFTADGGHLQHRRPGLGSSGTGVVIGDVLWTTQIETDGRTERLASIDLQTGAAVTWVDMPFGTFLVGQDETGRPMVHASAVSATYAFDIDTKQFDLVSATSVIDADGQRRIELRCDDHLVCHFVLHGPRDGIREGEITELADYSGNSTASLAPGGENVLITTYSPLAVSFDVVNVATRERVHLLNRSFANDVIPLAWSTDGRWLFFLNDNQLWAWRTGLPAPIEVLFDGNSVHADGLGVFPPQ